MLPLWIVLMASAAKFEAEIANPTKHITQAVSGKTVSQASSQQPKVQRRTKRNSSLLALIAAGHDQNSSGNYTQATDSFEAALALVEASPEAADKDLKGEILYGLSEAYFYLEQYAEAIPILESAIAHYVPTPTDDLSTSDYIDILIPLYRRLGFAHQALSNFGSALRYYQPLLSPEAIAAMPPEAAAIFLQNVGLVEAEIGQYANAEANFEQAAALNRQLNKTTDEAETLTNLGWIYEQQARFDDAIARYQSAITLYQKSNSSSGEIRTLNNLGIAQLKRTNLSAAETTLNQALTLLNSQSALPEDSLDAAFNPDKERAILLDSFGSLYQEKGEFERAWSAYRQALARSTSIPDPIGEIDSLLNLGQLMAAKDQPHAAVFFYKEAIARIETIRNDLKQLSTAIQKRYTLTVEDIYRNLADLLLQQDRTDEAVQILELLKIQEVTTYLNSSQSSASEGNRENNSLLSPAEAELAATFDTLPADLSLESFITRSEVTALSTPTQQPSGQTESLFQTEIIESLQATLKEQPVSTAALYPLILKDRLEIVLITPGQSPVHYAQPVTQEELAQIVHTLQNKLKTPALPPTDEAEQLYNWLIRPLEEALEQQNIENIIYLPDGVLRYIPIATLHDGEQWFAQKYQSHNITAAAIDELNRPVSNLPKVLAGAFTDASPAHNIQIGQQSYRYDGLPAARKEIDNLLSLIPDTTALFDQDFTPDNTLSVANEHQIVHLATHANFLPGQPESSFVLFGDGSTVNMQEIGQWELPDVDLVVFSACQTAVSTEGDGKELLGLGFQIQKTGAGAAIATLWSVNDDSTAAFMNQFYIALDSGQTKAAALRTAQLEMIKTQSFKHPYDWAAFILIGNGL